MLEIFGILKLAFAIYAAIALAKITFGWIINWFRKKRELKLQDKNNIAFTLKTEMESGNYVVCQGIFNTDRSELMDGQKLTAKEMDRELVATHQGKPLVIYE